jgi:predicted ferric reductase
MGYKPMQGKFFNHRTFHELLMVICVIIAFHYFLYPSETKVWTPLAKQNTKIVKGR